MSVCACGQPCVPHRIKSRPAPTTCGNYACRGRTGLLKWGRDRFAEWGRNGGRSSHVKRWADLLEKWQSLSPREALREAYKAGYHAGHQAGVTEKQKGKAA